LQYGNQVEGVMKMNDMMLSRANKKPRFSPLASLLVLAAMVISFTFLSPVYGQVDFDECGVFEVDFSNCVLFFPNGGLFNTVQVDIQTPPLGQLLRVTGTTFSCVGICFPDICVTSGQLFFDCPVFFS